MFDHEDGSCACGGHAVRRVNSKTGHSFWGCSNYPKCKNTGKYPHEGPTGDLLMSGDDYLEAWADAMYDGDGK